MVHPTKRVLTLFAALLLLFACSLARIMNLALGQNTLAHTAALQQTLVLTFSSGRGTIYDRNLQPMTGGKNMYWTAIVPSRAAIAALSRALTVQQMSALYPRLQAGAPFLTQLDVPVQGEGILSFPQQQRYPPRTLAAHLLGYLDSSGRGISGVEKAFDGVLSRATVSTKVIYQVDALRHLLPGKTPQVVRAPAGENSGVVLTLDRNLQKLAEDSVSESLQKGAVVILRAGSAEILAAASLPGFQPAEVSSVLRDSSGALVNRTLQAYPVGSVFKLASAAAALEYGIDPQTPYLCRGSETVDGMAFHCAGDEAHGSITMRQAIARSCNAYFIHCMQGIPVSRFLGTVRALGFGVPTQLAPGFSGSAGVLPNLSDLSNRRSLANFSFGQGKLLATPLQVAAMVNAVASGGIYREPFLYKGQANHLGKLTVPVPAAAGTPAMTQKTAALLQAGMQDCAMNGTGVPGQPLHVAAAVKTGTAQTGRKTESGEEALVNWYAGFFPAESPKYVVTVLSEGGESGGKTCGPIFQKIADRLYPEAIDKPTR